MELNEIVSEPVAFPHYEELIALLPVSSSMAASIAYDSHEQTLQVEFKSGAVYEYSGVDEETWEDFYAADSVGSFYNQQIKGRFDCERLHSINIHLQERLMERSKIIAILTGAISVLLAIAYLIIVQILDYRDMKPAPISQVNQPQVIVACSWHDKITQMSTII